MKANWNSLGVGRIAMGSQARASAADVSDKKGSVSQGRILREAVQPHAFQIQVFRLGT
jgi:hypothetical protein